MKWAHEPEQWLYGTKQGKKAKESLRLKLMGIAPAFTREEMLKFAKAFMFAGAELKVNRKTYSNYRNEGVKRKRTVLADEDPEYTPRAKDAASKAK